MHLTCIHPFTISGKDGEPDVTLKRGDKIHDEHQMAEVMAGENHKHVVRTAEPEAPPSIH
jgi:hypothetical protein